MADSGARLLGVRLLMADSKHIVMTGPVKKTFVLSNGVEVDTRPDLVYLDTQEEAAELAKLIGEYHADPQTPTHPDHDEETPFVYTPTEQ